MATYFTRDGKPVHTQFALPENHLGEVRGSPRLYTAQRLAVLNDRARERRHKRVQTMSEHSLAQHKTDYLEWARTHRMTLEALEAYHHMDEQLAAYWHGVNLECTLSKAECTDITNRVAKIHGRSRDIYSQTYEEIFRNFPQ